MKKLFQIVFASVLATMMFAFPVFASTPEPVKIPVTVQSVQNTAWVKAPVVQGRANVELEDGIQISVSGKVLDGLTLVVYPIPRSDEQAWAWIESCLEGYGTYLYPLDLFFVDDQGNRVEAPGLFTVTVTGAGEYQTPAVFYLAQNGAVTRMKSQAKGTAITFTTNHNNYYVLAEAEGIHTPEEPDEEGSGQPSDGNTSQSGGTSPQTGDDVQPLIWYALLLVSGGVFVISLFNVKKQKEN